MQDPWGAGTGKDATPPQGFFKNALTASKTPPGNALLAKEQAALARQAAGKNPSVTPAQIAHSLLNAAGINPKAILHNAAVMGSYTLPPQAGVKPGQFGNVDQAGIPIIGPGGLAHAGALGILPFKRLLGKAAEDVVAKEAPKVAVPEFAKAVRTPKPKIVYPEGTLFHGSPEGELKNVDALYHTKMWREGPGFYLTSNLGKAQKYAAGKTASAARKAGTGEINAFRLKPGAKVLNLDVQPESFWRETASKIIGEPVSEQRWREWANDIRPEDVKGGSVGILNRQRLMHFLTGYGELPKTDAYYAIEETIHEGGFHATLHSENGVPVHVVKDSSVLERVVPTVQHPLLRPLPTATAKTLGESVSEAMKGAPAARTEQQALRSPEYFNRSEAFGKTLQQNPTAAGALEARKVLAGKYPALSFHGFTEFSPEAHDAMVKAVSESPHLSGFEPVHATEALQKAFDGKLITAYDQKVLQKVFPSATVQQIVEAASGMRKLRALGYDVANLPRSVMASYDASGLLRQGLLYGTSHPVKFSKGVPVYLKSIGSKDFAAEMSQKLHEDPFVTSGMADRVGLDLTEMVRPGESAKSAEEPFRSTFGEKIPGVKQSSRGFTIGMNYYRLQLAKDLVAKAQRLDGKPIRRVVWSGGKPHVVTKFIDANDPKLLKSIGTVANSATGRGHFGDNVLGNSEEGLNLLFFSPKLIKSRVDFLNPFWYAKLDPIARHEAYRAMAGLVGLVGTADAIAQASGLKMQWNPRSSDFAKVKIGDTRLDLAGGFQQYIKLLVVLGSRSELNSSGQLIHLGPEGAGKTSIYDTVIRFIRSKTAPVTSTVWDLSQQKNAVGQPITWKGMGTRYLPLAGQDAVSVGMDAAKSTGNPFLGAGAGLGAFTLSAIGGGVQNYKPKAPKNSGSGGDPWGAGGGGNSGGDPWGASP